MAALLLGQFAVYALAWTVGLLMLRDERPAVAWWLACCVLQAAGLWLMLHQPAGTSGIWPPASVVLLAAYGAAVMGIDLFVNGRLRQARLRQRVAAARIAVPAGCPPLTLSIGIATRQPGDGSVQDLFVRADSGMYRDKREPAPAASAV